MAKLITIRNTRWPFYPNEFVSVKGPQGWGAVCADALNARAANVVCRSTRSLFGTRVRAASIAGSHTLYSGLMNCTGSEMSLAECNMSLVVQEKCEKKEAVVDCTGGVLLLLLLTLLLLLVLLLLSLPVVQLLLLLLLLSLMFLLLLLLMFLFLLFAVLVVIVIDINVFISVVCCSCCCYCHLFLLFAVLVVIVINVFTSVVCCSCYCH